MVITILEAEVTPERQNDLQAAYAKLAHPLPPSIVESYLAQSRAEPANWRIITVWRSAEDLAAMRASGETPTGVVIFNAAGANPTLSIHDVAKTAVQE